MGSSLRQHFLLEPDIHYLNHGSFGACPRPVFESFQAWQLELEKNPMAYYTRQLKGMFSKEASGPLEDARQALADFIGTGPEGLVFVPNVTIALNMIAHSMELGAGDEVLLTDHEYGTIEETWRQHCERQGAALIKAHIPLPLPDDDSIERALWEQVSSRTRVIVCSHITSATAVTLPIARICARARREGILTVIDGAHAVGQIELDLSSIQADFYTSNCHKWLLTPKGTAFLHVHEKQRENFRPMVISWAEIFEPSFSLRHEMWGTRDMAGYLSIPEALRFREACNWAEALAEARDLLLQEKVRFEALCEAEPLCDNERLPSMAAVALPTWVSPIELWSHFLDQHRIESMISVWHERPLLRLGLLPYNELSELDLKYSALSDFLEKGPAE